MSKASLGGERAIWHTSAAQQFKNSMTDDVRVIKKYPNRRLYDTAISRYITLEEIRQLVIEEIKFVVIDKRTRQDITRNILLQVIADQEEGGNPLFRTQLLEQLIRFYGDSMQSTASHYLELSLQLFIERSGQLKDQLRNRLGTATPLQSLKELAAENTQLWRAVRREFVKNLPRGKTGGRPEDEDDLPPPQA